MTPRTPHRIRFAHQARSARAGILLARQHMGIHPKTSPLAGVDVSGKLFADAYLRTKVRIGTDRRKAAAPDPLAELYRWIDGRLARENVPARRRPDRNRGLTRFGGCSIQYYDHDGIRRVFFFVTTADYSYVDGFLPRYQGGKWAPIGWLPAIGLS